MTLLQLGIGTINDVVDAPRDAQRKPGKPIPAGLVGRRPAVVGALACFASGVAVAALQSAATGAIALAVIAIGLAYDVGFKGTVWSWLPFAVGIPVLPVFGWLAVTATLPVAFVILIPTAVVAGAALAIGNALVDVERDRAAGITSVAAAIGPVVAHRVATGLFLGVWIAATISVSALVPGTPGLLVILVLGFVPSIAAAAAGAGTSPRRREVAWRVEAIGTAALATAWLAIVLPGSTA